MAARRTANLGGLGLLVLTTVIWGATFPLVGQVVARVPPVQLVAWRFALAAAVLLPWLRGGGGLRAALPGFAVGAANAAGFLLQTFALRTASADVVAFLTGLSVVLVPAAHAVWRRRRPPGQVLAALGLGLVGLALLTTGGPLRWSPGDLLGAACAFLFAVQVLGTARLAGRVGATRLAAQQVVAGAVLFGLAALVWHPAWLAPPPRSDWPVIGFLAVVATVGTFALQTSGQARVDATTAAITFNLEPVFAAVWAFALTGQLLGGRGWAGAGLILIGMVLAALAPGDPEAAPAQGALAAGPSRSDDAARDSV